MTLFTVSTNFKNNNYQKKTLDMFRWKRTTFEKQVSVEIPFFFIDQMQIILDVTYLILDGKGCKIN